MSKQEQPLLPEIIKLLCASLMSGRFMSSEGGLPVETKAENQICLTNREARDTALYLGPF